MKIFITKKSLNKYVRRHAIKMESIDKFLRNLYYVGVKNANIKIAGCLCEADYFDYAYYLPKVIDIDVIECYVKNHPVVKHVRKMNENRLFITLNQYYQNDGFHSQEYDGDVFDINQIAKIIAMITYETFGKIIDEKTIKHNTICLSYNIGEFDVDIWEIDNLHFQYKAEIYLPAYLYNNYLDKITEEIGFPCIDDNVKCTEENSNN